jgi:DNA-binding XRE family transcriptional regulator
LTAKKRRQFIKHLRNNGNITSAARSIGISRQTAYNLRKENPKFAASWNNAIQEHLDQVEEELRRRACNGVDEDVYYQGTVCGTVKKYSDTLLMFYLKARRPEVFSDKLRQEITGKDGAAIEISSLSTEQKLARIAELLERARARRDSSISPEPSSSTS